jgi:hypothetical protein
VFKTRLRVNDPAETVSSEVIEAPETIRDRTFSQAAEFFRWSGRKFLPGVCNT